MPSSYLETLKHHAEKEMRTRRDTATPTSRLVGHITRNMNLNPRLNTRPR